MLIMATFVQKLGVGDLQPAICEQNDQITCFSDKRFKDTHSQPFACHLKKKTGGFVRAQPPHVHANPSNQPGALGDRTHVRTE